MLYTSTGKGLTAPLLHTSAVRSTRFTSDGLYVISVTDDNRMQVIDARRATALTAGMLIESGQELHRHQLQKSYSSVSVRDTETGRTLGEPAALRSEILAAELSADAAMFCTVSRDRTVRVWDTRTGVALSALLPQYASISIARFSPNGKAIFFVTDRTVRVWSLPDIELPAPAWLLDLAECVAGQKVNDQELAEFVEPATLGMLANQLTQNQRENAWIRWAKWFFADRRTRTISPFSPITIPEYIQRRIQENTLESLKEALDLSPTNGLAFARLAKVVLDQNDKDNPYRVGEADFCSRHAVKLAPQNAEVAKIRAEIAAQLQTLKAP